MQRVEVLVVVNCGGGQFPGTGPAEGDRSSRVLKERILYFNALTKQD
jgi:hypothetical protein